MNVLYVVDASFPEGPSAQRALSIAKALRELGVHVTFLVGEFNTPEWERVNDIQFHAGFRCQAFNSKPTPLERDRLHVRRYAERSVLIKKWLDHTEDRKFEAVLLYNGLSSHHLALLPYCRARHIPLIIDCTEWRDSRSLYPGLRWLLHRWDAKLCLRYFNVQARNVIAISSFLADFYQARNVRVIRVPPLIDLADSKWAVVTTPHSATDPLRFMYGGNPGRKDALENILEAFCSLKQAAAPVQLELVGASQQAVEACGPRAGQLIDQLGDTLKLHGRYPTAGQALQKLSEADVLILIKYQNISTQAQFPSKLPEYLALGRPVIINDTSDVREYVQDGTHGFVVEGLDPEDIVRAICRVLDVREQLGAMGKSSRALAESAFDYHRHSQRLLEFLKDARS